MKDRSKKNKSIQLRLTASMYSALVNEADRRECSIPEAVRYAVKKFYKISYQK